MKNNKLLLRKLVEWIGGLLIVIVLVGGTLGGIYLISYLQSNPPVKQIDCKDIAVNDYENGKYPARCQDFSTQLSEKRDQAHFAELQREDQYYKDRNK